MATQESNPRCFAKCRTCGAVFSATPKPNETLQPHGIPPECACGEADFYPLLHGESDRAR